MPVRQQLIWVKDVFVMGRHDYHYRHEPILYGWKEGAAHAGPTRTRLPVRTRMSRGPANGGVRRAGSARRRRWWPRDQALTT